MKRRVLLRWIGAGAAAKVLPAEQLTAPPPGMAIMSSIGFQGPTSVGEAGCSNGWSEADAAALKTLRRKLERVERDASRRSYKRERTLLLCGGHAPQVATCQSWAPWFKAQATVRWQMEQEAVQIAEERARSRSVAAGFTSMLKNMLPDWLAEKLEDDA